MPEDTPTPDDTTFSIDDWISGATRPETVIMLSSKGREYGQFQTLEQELLAAQKAAADSIDDRLVGGSDVHRIAVEMDALAKVIDKGRSLFRLRGLPENPVEGDPQPSLKALREQNEDADEDDTNMALLAACCINPKLTPAQWAKMRGALGEGQYVQCIRAARQVTYGEALSAPFSLVASVALATAKS